MNINTPLTILGDNATYSSKLCIYFNKGGGLAIHMVFFFFNQKNICLYSYHMYANYLNFLGYGAPTL